jgi:hypothetical protein
MMTANERDCTGNSMHDRSLREVVICIPVFNDWEASLELVRQIDSEASGWDFAAQILLVDDGSTDHKHERSSIKLNALQKFEVLHLRRNLGHQRAIAVGLAYIHDSKTCDAVVVMDGDGEDSPTDIAKLVSKYRERHGTCVIFAKRAKRTEGLLFKLLFLVFRIVHRVLTGRRIEVGNFSLVPRHLLARLVVVSETWNHYAAAVFKALLPVDMVPIDKTQRIAGSSKMNFVALITHGLSAMSVFADTVGARLLIGSCIMTLVVLIGLIVCIVSVFSMEYSLPGWVTPTIGVLLVILLQTFVMSLVFVFIALQGRASLTFLPLRDYHFFVQELLRIDANGSDL